MPFRVEPRSRTFSAYLFVGLLVASILIAIVVLYSRHPTANSNGAAPPSEATAYLSHLALSDVSMKASENFMNQQVVEIEGKLTNKGPRVLRSVEVYCLFRGVDGREIHRERVAVIPARGTPVRSGETRAFRLPFDTLPEGWNQAMPGLVIASIQFSNSPV